MSIPTDLLVHESLPMAGDRAWRENVRVLYDYLRRDMADERVQRLRRYPKNGPDHAPRTVPLVWRMARELATAYLRPAARQWRAADAVGVWAARVYAAIGVDAAMREAHEQMVALANATIWVMPVSQGVRLEIIPPHLQAVEFTPGSHDERDVKTWWFARPVVVDPQTGLREYAYAEVTKYRAVWVKGPASLQGKGLWADDGANPMGTIPVVMLRGARPAPHEWWAPAPTDLLDAQRAINHDLTDVGEVARRQGYSQAYMVDPSRRSDDQVFLGLEEMALITDPAGSFGYATPSANISGMVEQAKQYIDSTVAMSGLNPATFTKSTGITALAKRVELHDRETERERHGIELRRAEQRLYGLINLGLGVSAGGAPPWPDAVVEVEWRLPEPPADPQGDAAAAETEDRIGLYGVARRRAEREGISLAEAQALVLEDRRLSLEREALANVPTT